MAFFNIMANKVEFGSYPVLPGFRGRGHTCFWVERTIMCATTYHKYAEEAFEDARCLSFDDTYLMVVSSDNSTQPCYEFLSEPLPESEYVHWSASPYGQNDWCKLSFGSSTYDSDLYSIDVKSDLYRMDGGNPAPAYVLEESTDYFGESRI